MTNEKDRPWPWLRHVSAGVRWRAAGAALLAASLAPGLPSSARAEAASRTHASATLPTFVSLTVDNDFFAGFDRHYTNGIQLAFSAATGAVPASLGSLPPFRWSTQPWFTFSVGQRIYTPTDTDRVDPDPLDRPYAGWLYALADVCTRSGATVDHVQAGIGLIGPASLAERTQNAYHRLTGSELTRGWDAQLGHELGLLLGYERAWPRWIEADGGHLEADLTPRVGATAGNVFTYANAGLVLRAGRNLPDDFPVTFVSLGPPRDGYRTGGTGFGWYAWLGTEVRLVAYNVFLDGNTFRHSRSVDREPFGYDLQLGLVMVRDRMRLGFTLVRRSEEFKTQQGADRFGQLTLSFPLHS
ncbi:MAG TPA: lipid A deacylase LpxR family protein [Burkholderiales bacterium]|nr:lipid A deacylase LpxR family protein [Burkholderiales bacterium]